MSNRFFSETPLKPGPFQLQGDQAHHVANVMRKKVGETVVMFDGSGQEFVASISSVGKKKVDLVIESGVEVSRELGNSITIAVALPKGDRQKFLVEKLVELGVAKLIPLTTRRGVAHAKPNTLERLRKQVVEASKQCERNRLMEVDSPLTIQQLVNSRVASERCWVAHPYHATPLAEFRKKNADANANVFAIGPEGGFTEEEVSQFGEADWEAVSFGPAILRVETAAICAAVEARRFA